MKFGQHRLTETSEKKSGKQRYSIAIGLMISYASYYFFLEPSVIGHDNRYAIYIFLLPTLSGLLILAVYRRQFLINNFSSNKGFLIRTFMLLFYLIQGLIFSYLSFGQAAKISWDILNTRTAKQNAEEIFDCKITRFWTSRRSNNIDFLFKDRHNKFKVQHSVIKDYLDTNPSDYYLEIRARKGLWNYYLVEDWDIRAKSDLSYPKQNGTGNP
jgi:hypothetical protein